MISGNHGFLPAEYPALFFFEGPFANRGI